jgi:LPXTG-motif cell wall-anchored protein
MDLFTGNANPLLAVGMIAIMATVLFLLLRNFRNKK